MKNLIALLLFILFSLTGFSQSTFNDVAPSLYRNCTTCHRVGGGAPFSMLSYSTTAPWTSAMQTALTDGEMPPWGADTSYLHFSNEREISQADKDTILQWIADGALQGNPSLLPPPPNYPQYKLNGTPDTILYMQPFNSNAGANDAYNTFIIPLSMSQSRYVRAIELIPSDPSLIHHSIIRADTAGDILADTSGNSFTILGDLSVGTYAPGTQPIIFPNSSQLKMGIPLPANGDIIMQMHTPAGTFGQTIAVEIRLYFYPIGETGIRPVYDFVPLQYWENDFWIAPNQIKTFSTEQVTFPYDISIYSAFPHSHQICTEILNYAYDTTTLDTTKLIKIDQWDFEHQEYYYYKNLVKIPTGYKYHSDHVFDNTPQNHHNPNNPPQLVTVGPYSYDEMLFDGFQFIVYQTGDELINIDSILAEDPLLTVGIWEGYSPKEKITTSTVYPNPLNNKATISFNNPVKLTNAVLKVWSMEGKSVEIQYQIENNQLEITKGTLTPNIYIYQVFDANNNKVSAGKLIIQ